MMVSIAVAASAVLLTAPVAAAAPPVNFNRDIRPILSNNCYKCHGPDAAERKAGLRLDLRDEALKPLRSKRTAIVPGKPDESLLIKAVRGLDKDLQMPPQKPLTAQEVEVRFSADGGGTLVELEHRGWQKLGARAAEARAGYDEGWTVVLGEHFAAAAGKRAGA